MTLTAALKVHLRVLEIHRAVLRVVTLRPQTPVRFSTNYFHDTWHILAGADGAALFGRLLWGLAFQRHPGTLLLIPGFADGVSAARVARREVIDRDPIATDDDRQAIYRRKDDAKARLRLARRRPG